jgi:hypothetical protein
MVVSGDILFVGLWYYMLVPAATLTLAIVMRAKPLFLSGASLAIAVSLLTYMYINWRLTRPEGLLALGHVFSLPGAAVGMALAIFFGFRLKHPAHLLVIGIGGTACGFLANQLLVCNSLLWCGPFTRKGLVRLGNMGWSILIFGTIVLLVVIVAKIRGRDPNAG